MDQQTILKCAKGDVAAQATIYEAYASQMFAICLRYAPDRATAEDMLQDGFIKVFTKIGTFKGDGPLGAWIRRVIVNVSLEHLRRLQVASKRFIDLEFSQTLPATENIIEKLTFNEVIDAVQLLPENYRSVLNLYAIDGYSHKEIAKMLSISEGNSKQRLRRARNMLKAILMEQHDVQVDETAA